MREFHISPKAPRDWLMSQRNWSKFQTRVRVADDIIANARELENGVDWHEILSTHTIAIAVGKRYTGKLAIVHSISSTVGSVAARMEWDMHSPEIVYMSGYHFFWGLGKDIDHLNTRIATAQERSFVSEEAKQATLKREIEDASRLGSFRKRLGESLDAFADQKFPAENRDAYLEILKELIYLPHRRIYHERYDVFELLKRSDIQGAASILNRSPS